MLTAVAYREAGQLRLDAGETALGVADLERALALARRSGHRRLETSALNRLGLGYRDAGDLVRAADALDQALALARGGGDLFGLASALTGKLFGLVPTSLVFLAAVVILVWIPFRRSVLGRAVYAAGSSEVAAYMSGMPVKRAKFAAYVLSGVFAAIAGLFLTFFTYSGEASAANGNTYTLYSIAAVVLGGVSLFGGRGSAIGAIFASEPRLACTIESHEKHRNPEFIGVPVKWS